MLKSYVFMDSVVYLALNQIKPTGEEGKLCCQCEGDVEWIGCNRRREIAASYKYLTSWYCLEQKIIVEGFWVNVMAQNVEIQLY